MRDIENQIYAKQVVALASRRLSDREKELLTLRANNYTQKTIAEEWGISITRVRQIEDGAKRKMRQEIGRMNLLNGSEY